MFSISIHVFYCFDNRNGGSDVRNGACLEPRSIMKAPEGQGCPRCGGFVYMAEQMLARGRVSIVSIDCR